MTSPCGPTWHRHFLADGGVTWFRLLGRWRDPQRTIGYNTGPEPDDRWCRKIWCYDGRAWTCHACGRLIDVEGAATAG